MVRFKRSGRTILSLIKAKKSFKTVARYELRHSRFGMIAWCEDRNDLLSETCSTVSVHILPCSLFCQQNGYRNYLYKIRQTDIHISGRTADEVICRDLIAPNNDYVHDAVTNDMHCIKNIPSKKKQQKCRQ